MSDPASYRRTLTAAEPSLYPTGIVAYTVSPAAQYAAESPVMTEVNEVVCSISIV